MAEGAATRALREALKAAPPAPRDGATVALAKRYAALLDASAVPSRYRLALERLEGLCGDAFDRQALERIREALSAHTVASDLGPKYLACLAQLGLTPAARGVKAAAVPVDGGEPAAVQQPRSTRDDLKARRAKRLAGGAG